MRKIITFLGMVAVFLWGGVALQAQEEEQDRRLDQERFDPGETRPIATYEEQFANGKYFRALRPEEIPQHSLVYHFFLFSTLFLEEEPAPVPYHRFLRSLKLEPGTQAADVFTQAVLEARFALAVERQEGEADIDREETLIRELAKIYTSLLNSLEREGAPRELVDEFIEREIRPGTSVLVMNDEPLGKTLPTVDRLRAAFHDEVSFMNEAAENAAKSEERRQE